MPHISITLEFRRDRAAETTLITPIDPAQMIAMDNGKAHPVWQQFVS